MTTEDNEARDIDLAIFDMVRKQLKQKNSTLVSPENEFHYRHGQGWTHVDTASHSSNTGMFHEHSAELSIQTQSIIDNDERVIVRFVKEMSDAMHATFARSVFATVGDAAESVGNSITFSIDQSLTQEERGRAIRSQVADMIDKIDLSVDKFGRVSYPSFHIGPDNKEILYAISLPETLEEQLRTYEMQRRKESEAIGREAERLSMYVRRDND
ncbi:MAG: hypothetical protein ACTHLT_10020 [Devosia sp.]